MVSYNEEELVKFIKDNKQLIINCNFDLLYSMIDNDNDLIKSNDLIKPNQLTQFLLDCGINPLNYVTEIVYRMFFLVELPEKFKDLKVPYTVNILCSSCFAYCNLASIDLNNVKTIGSCAFLACKNLKSIDLKNVKSVGGYTFADCAGLKTVYAPKGLNLSRVDAPEDCNIIRR